MDGGFGHFIDQLLDEGRTQAMQKLSQLIGGLKIQLYCMYNIHLLFYIDGKTHLHINFNCLSLLCLATSVHFCVSLSVWPPSPCSSDSGSSKQQHQTFDLADRPGTGFLLTTSTTWHVRPRNCNEDTRHTNPHSSYSRVFFDHIFVELYLMWHAECG